jgi:hypothetical protein
VSSALRNINKDLANVPKIIKIVKTAFFISILLLVNMYIFLHLRGKNSIIKQEHNYFHAKSISRESNNRYTVSCHSAIACIFHFPDHSPDQPGIKICARMSIIIHKIPARRVPLIIL